MTGHELYLFHFSKQSIKDVKCEVTGKPVERISHIHPGAPKKLMDDINNLIALAPEMIGKLSKDDQVKVHQKVLLELARKNGGKNN